MDNSLPNPREPAGSLPGLKTPSPPPLQPVPAAGTSVGAAPPKIRVPKAYYKETQDIIGQLETKLSTKIIVYYTPDKYFISQEDPDYFLEQIRDIGFQEKISLILVSRGGNSAASLRIATLLRQYCNTLDIIVPSVCASAATHLALSGDRILMSPQGFLTAIDTSIIHPLNPPTPAGSPPLAIACDAYKRVYQMLQQEGVSKNADGEMESPLRTLLKYIHPVVIGEMERSSKGSERIAEQMMRMHPQSFQDDEQIRVIANHLTNNYPEHGYPIMFQEAKEIGLPTEKLSEEITYLLWDLIKYYRAVTRLIETHFSPIFYHVEENANIIESLKRRIVHRVSFNRRLNSLTKRWDTVNDNGQWVKLSPSDKPDQPYNTFPIEIPENEGVVMKKLNVKDDRGLYDALKKISDSDEKLGIKRPEDSHDIKWEEDAWKQPKESPDLQKEPEKNDSLIQEKH